jgi:LysM repeat protein
MTDVDGRPVSVLERDADLSPVARLCPYLLAEGGWRSPSPSGDHRCTAVDPPARLASAKQARLCLAAAHADCATYAAALASRAARDLPPSAARRPLARTAPIVLERARHRLPVDVGAGSTRWGQAGLVLLMVIALVAVVLARTAPSGSRAPGGAATPAGAGASSYASAAAPVTPSAPGSSASGPVASASGPVASASAFDGSPSAPPPSVAASYTVRKGDTLSGIAATFGTTVAALQKANGLTSTTLRVGQVLTIP